MTDRGSESLARAAHRATQQRFFLASVFAAFQTANKLDDAALAHLLDCSVHVLPRLALCRRPAAEPAAFSADIDHLARRFQVDGERLAAIVRQVDALQALQQHMAGNAHAADLLRAARDRDESDQANQEDMNG